MTKLIRPTIGIRGKFFRNIFSSRNKIARHNTILNTPRTSDAFIPRTDNKMSVKIYTNFQTNCGIKTEPAAATIIGNESADTIGTVLVTWAGQC